MDHLRGEIAYQKYKQKGFSTPTGKFELYSTMLEKWGYDPLPQYREPPESPISTPELLSSYPYILVTGRRLAGFFHTENRQLSWMRELHPDPIVEIHPQTAEKEGIEEGDWVLIESPRGRIRQRAKLFEGIDPRVVTVYWDGKIDVGFRRPSPQYSELATESEDDQEPDFENEED